MKKSLSVQNKRPIAFDDGKGESGFFEGLAKGWDLRERICFAQSVAELCKRPAGRFCANFASGRERGREVVVEIAKLCYDVRREVNPISI